MIKLIQISDCHIDDQAVVMGVDTQANLKKIVKELDDCKFEALLISGDLTHNGTANSYTYLKEILSPIEVPIHVIAGNHDNVVKLNIAFKDNLFSCVEFGNWEMISINSVQPEKTSGLVTSKALAELDQRFLNSNADHILVVLHHPIVAMNSSWDDSLSLENPQDLFQVLDKHSKIRCVVFGHAHESADFYHQNCLIVSCPSTALQFNQESRIGFNEFTLHDDGQINWTTQWI
ncbi:3',5'-cyclic-nucleotide phosphodiesterase [uncultured Candidatus Thioglobus sp.]|nr:3',5'-cyclic-nucleotide phosphodiesterase [uncultured Candidatus Thioglobus sp.]